jgi:hypothetical protein
MIPHDSVPEYDPKSHPEYDPESESESESESEPTPSPRPLLNYLIPQTGCDRPKSTPKILIPYKPAPKPGPKPAHKPEYVAPILPTIFSADVAAKSVVNRGTIVRNKLFEGKSKKNKWYKLRWHLSMFENNLDV